jgi:Cu2+-exporting ATPase
MVKDYQTRFWVSLLLTIPVFVLSPMIQEHIPFLKSFSFTGDIYVCFLLSTVIFFYGGWPFLKGAYNELAALNPAMMTLIALAIIVAYAYSTAIVFGLAGKIFFWELASLIDIMLLGHWIEMRSVMGAGRALDELVKLLPQTAHQLQEDGSLVDISLDQLQKGDRVVVKPGEKVPADGRIQSGSSSLNQALLTGEAVPVFKSKGEQVIGGAINGEGALTVVVEKLGKDSFISQVIDLVKDAQQSKSKTQDIASKAAFWLTLIAIFVGSLTFICWMVFHGSISFALERSVSVMVVTCPHALGLAVPLVVAVSTSLGAANGLLIRNRAAFELSRKIDAIVFDKTGTLTKGEFEVVNVVCLGTKFSKDEILAIAASVESHSEHPIAKGILRSVKNPKSVVDFQSIAGKGAQGIVEGKKVQVVSPQYVRDLGQKIPESVDQELQNYPNTAVFVLVNDQLAAMIALSDKLREESKEAIEAFQNLGIKCYMLTGDTESVANQVAKEIGLNDYFANVLPQQKREKIQEVQKTRAIVAMAGDGVNDAPALAQADVGIAIGAGTDVAIETADIILVKNSPMDALSLIVLAKKTYRKMVENLVWATGYNVIAIPVAAGVLYPFGMVLSPSVAAILMSLSTVICAVNAKLLTLKTTKK